MPVPLIDHAAPLLARYDAVFCDIWGVLHDGVAAYPGANDCLPRFRAAGGTVILVSNAPLPGGSVARVLAEKKVRADVYDAIVSSGDLARAHITERGYARVHHIGPSRDLPTFEGLAVERVALEDAEALVFTGLVDDRREKPEDYDGLIARARARGLEFVCANPDLVVEVGGVMLPCAGSVAARYEALGGSVYWAGKPYPPAYAAAFAAAGRVRGGAVPPARVLAIGDAVRTDLAGAAGAGIDALFVTHGIHRDAVAPGGTIDLDRLRAAFGDAARTTVAATSALRW